jgi:hypothetical protein
LSAGPTNITATFGGKTSNTAILTVNAKVLMSIMVTPALASIPVLGTYTFKATAIYNDGSTLDVTGAPGVAWTSSDHAVAANPINGSATGLSAGPTNITATFGGKTSNTAILTVNAKVLMSIMVTPALASIPVHGTQHYTAIATYDDGSTLDVTTNVANNWGATGTIAPIGPHTGIATAGAIAGTTNITATFGGKTSNSALLTVNAATLVSIKVMPATAAIPVDGTQQFLAIATYDDGSISDETKNVNTVWTSADVAPASGVATVSSIGVATGHAPGKSHIMASYNVGPLPYKTDFAILTVTNAPNLRTAATFGIFGGSAGMTNTGNLTVITGSGGNTADIGTTAVGNSSITGFHEKTGLLPADDHYTDTLGANSGEVTGLIYTCAVSTTGDESGAFNAAECAIATQGRSDANAAYLALAARPSDGPLAGNLTGTTITPGVWTNATSVMIQGGDLTLDAQGDADAVFVFQIGSTLLVGGPGATAPQSVILINGAQAKNVFWQVGTAATINAAGGGTMVGTIISSAGITFSTAGNMTPAILNGRALSLNASVTMVNTKITVPAP